MKSVRTRTQERKPDESCVEGDEFHVGLSRRILCVARLSPFPALQFTTSRVARTYLIFHDLIFDGCLVLWLLDSTGRSCESRGVVLDGTYMLAQLHAGNCWLRRVRE